MTSVRDLTDEEVKALRKKKLKSAIVKKFILSVEIVITSVGNSRG